MSEAPLAQMVQRASAHQRVGRLAEAEAICRQILATSPGYPDALHLLGLIALGSGRLQEAASRLEQTIALQPGNSPAHSNLGEAYLRQHRVHEAVAVMQTAVRLQPERAEAHVTLAHSLRAARRYEEAVEVSRNAVLLRPDMVIARLALAAALHDLARFDEAIISLRQALDLEPTRAETYTNLALAFGALGKYDEAVAYYQRALEHEPQFAPAHHHLAMTQLLTGNFREGWTKYEWRFQVPDPERPSQIWPMPRWDGTPMPGETLLLHAEQGFGDTLQFVRYVPLVRARSGARRVILGCPAALVPLLAPPGNLKADLTSQVTVTASSRPRIHRHLPLMSLPLALGILAPDDPAIPPVPYVSANPRLAQPWRERLRPTRGLRVGLAWSGRPTHLNDARRSITLEQFAPLAQVPDVTFYSLQLPRPGPSPLPPGGMTFVDLSAQFSSFADTAALIEELDLVITVDTATAHLAGAMGKPVWTLIARANDWRWGTEGERTPWYPSMRLFRQRAHGDWDGLLQEVAEALRALPR